MSILINETPVEFDFIGKSVRQVVQNIDRDLEKINFVITGISLNNNEIHTNFDSYAEQILKENDNLSVTTEAVSDIKAKAISTILNILIVLEGDEDISQIQSSWEGFSKTFTSFFSAEECSFLESIGSMIQNPQALSATEKMKRCRELSLFFKERLDECIQPVEAMQAGAQLFERLRSDLANTSVLLQTGKEQEAIRNITLLIEIINKVIRIMPGFFITLRIANEPVINDEKLSVFFENFNKNLNELIAAFENKDTVLLGDLIEYEILPKLEALFASFKMYSDKGI
ncbi:MAG TPA: hypothetical protein P5519_11895 [Spirochaetia bacterium]|nr:hypothetical protein [Spirochaetales bacterium]HOT58870.1 hypothetical protein [Spirochaetales bacterium]HPD80489.1 hypothetical protein [Spirochaetales bacterium]HQK33703.1 hypothetical protein [Spirochaetales bacterium]HRS66577.1 hypothetical protein [Spirochaetia bacterium]